MGRLGGSAAGVGVQGGEDLRGGAMTDSWTVKVKFMGGDTISLYGGWGMERVNVGFESPGCPFKACELPAGEISDASDAVALFKKYRGMVEDEMWAADEVYRMFVYGGKR